MTCRRIEGVQSRLRWKNAMLREPEFPKKSNAAKPMKSAHCNASEGKPRQRVDTLFNTNRKLHKRHLRTIAKTEQEENMPKEGKKGPRLDVDFWHPIDRAGFQLYDSEWEGMKITAIKQWEWFKRPWR